MAHVMARKDAIVAESRERVEAWMRRLKGNEVIVGHARFIPLVTIEVGGRRLRAPRNIFNVGARALRPALPGIHDVPSLNKVSLMELRVVPEPLVIVGCQHPH